MGYFQTNAAKLALRLKPKEGKPGLRQCQVGAYWATLAHFTASNDPAMIVMPTGAGKTALMMLLSFGLEACRVLVITPAIILRDQTYEKFRTLDDLVEAGALPQSIKKPKTHAQEGRITSKNIWTELRKFDVVIATPHTTSRGYHNEIVKPPQDLFDLVFFDEAHHAKAPSWDILLQDFSKSKCVLLTATPFRLDRQRLPGRIVYYYPIGRAIESGIYRPIQYHPITAPVPTKRNQLLCEKAKELLNSEKAAGRRTKILIRTDRVAKSRPIIDLYRSQGLRVSEVNYMRTLRENNSVLEDIKKDALDGVVCVGMLGEGLDIPELKIAILHDPPKSFPFTVQFIGRVSRPLRGRVGRAHVVADPDEIRARKTSEELRRLYRRDQSWHQLVPRLVEDVVGPILRQDQALVPGLMTGAINPTEISPFFSARLYKVPEKRLNLTPRLKLESAINFFQIAPIDEAFLGLITETVKKPPWATRLELESVAYDLHLYYYHRPSETLFESTTSDVIAAKIRAQIVPDMPKRLGGEELIKVMQGRGALDYLMVGLANALGRCAALPTYKILMGQEVQGAVNPSEGRVFVSGHALARLHAENETRGIANFQGRVWSIKRAALTEYVGWCKEIGKEILKNRSAKTLREFPFLLNPRRVINFPDTPIEVIFNPFYVTHSFSFIRSIPAEEPTVLPIASPRFELQKLARDRNKLHLGFVPSEGQVIPLTYDLGKDIWETCGGASYTVKVDTGSGVESWPLHEFLSQYPPYIYLRNGGLIVSGQVYQPSFTYAELPKGCFIKGIDWAQCDVKVEFCDPDRGIQPQRGKKSIHDWLEQRLISDTTGAAAVFKDHGAGEIADFVVLDPRPKKISFYHCKSADRRDKRPGANIGQLKDVLHQVLRSVAWIRKPDFPGEILRRIEGAARRPDSKLVKGTVDTIKNLREAFIPSAWKYDVVIVQPGLDCEKVRKQRNTNILLLNCYEWLRHIDAGLAIMCYCG